MKKRLILIVLAVVLVLALTLAACTEPCEHDYQNGVCTKCGEKDPDYKPVTPPASLPTDIPVDAATPTLQLHYYRDNPADYLKWGFWIWINGGEGKVYKLNYTDDFGGVALYPLSELYNVSSSGTILLIPR